MVKNNVTGLERKPIIELANENEHYHQDYGDGGLVVMDMVIYSM